MFVLGHVGLTWGGAALGVELSRRLPWRRLRVAAVPVGGIDHRLVIVGSLLPDIIDKPLGVFIFADELSNGRIVGHSLLFVLAVALAALLWRGRGRAALGLLAAGSAAHLVEDRMWRDQHALFWPLVGLRPERLDVDGWVGQMLDQLVSDPYTYVSEIVGAAVFVALLAAVLLGPGLRSFLADGRMSAPVPPAVGRLLRAGEERPQQMERSQRPAER